jgi:hypothetical protein
MKVKAIIKASQMITSIMRKLKWSN